MTYRKKNVKFGKLAKLGTFDVRFLCALGFAFPALICLWCRAGNEESESEESDDEER